MLSESLRGVIAQALLPRANHKGRVPVVEILVNIPAVANLVREGKSHQIATVMQTGRSYGMMTFDAAIQDLVQKGLVSSEEGASFLRRRAAGKSAAAFPVAASRLTTSPAIN
jgi:twitching motility protein PilT